MLEQSVFDVHLLYAIATMGGLLLLRGAWALLASAQDAQPPLPADHALHAAALAQAVQGYTLVLDAFEAPPAEPEALQSQLSQQLARILALQRRVLPERAECAAQLQSAHGCLMDFLWHERVLCIRQDLHTRRDPGVFATLSQEVRAALQALAQDCGNVAPDAEAAPARSHEAAVA